jgi:peroxiredoxin 2/4
MINQDAPSFSGKIVNKDEITDFKSEFKNDDNQWNLLIFYPLDFTFVCPTELIGFSNAVKKFSELNTKVIGISCDSEYVHHAWLQTPRKEGGIQNLNFPLFSDLSQSVSKNYGAFLEGDNHPCRATFIIDPNGKIRHYSMNHPPVGRNVDEYLRLIEGYQFTDKNGVVCPLNWKKGDDTIIDNPVDKLEYFSKHN